MTIKVFQWASGTVGRWSAQAVMARPELELVGLHVRSPDKVGRDIGTLLGGDDVGLAATGEVEQVLESDADVVVHAPLASLVYGEDPDQDLNDICTLLEAGKDVVTVVGYLYPPAHGPAVVERLTSACAAGGTTFHSTGLNPGWMGDLLPVTMSALSDRIDRIVVREISNFQHYPSPEIMFDSMGFGAAQEVFEQQSERRSKWLNALFRESILMVGDGAGMALTDVVQEMALALAPADLDTASGPVRAGTVAGQRWIWRGLCEGEERVVHETVWRMHESVAPEWPVGDHSVSIEGEPNMHLDIGAAWISDGLRATAMHAVNAIAPVHAAAPGIATLLDLPFLRRRIRQS